LVIACAAIVGSGQVKADDYPTNQPPPAYKTVRYDEDYRYLHDPERKSDFLDVVKYIPLDKNGSWYASFGGEIREKYEYYENYNWGLGPQDPNGYLLQRYLLSGDLHYEDTFRVFGQFMAALEDGRTNGPRPTDEDVGDLHQGFLDVKFDLEDKGAFTTRIGRQEMYYGSQRLVQSARLPTSG
jgi:Alginate export